jgi:8-oxo-dGTP diphosphatase
MQDPCLITVAVVVVLGPEDTVTFVQQQRGPYAGFWLLPGGKVKFGEPITTAARREIAEECGFQVGDLNLTGVYEIFGSGNHFVIWGYRSHRASPVPSEFSGHHVGTIRQEHWDRIEPHPTDMPILNDTGVAHYQRELIEDRLAAQNAAMTNLLTGDVYGSRGHIEFGDR